MDDGQPGPASRSQSYWRRNPPDRSAALGLTDYGERPEMLPASQSLQTDQGHSDIVVEIIPELSADRSQSLLADQGPSSSQVTVVSLLV